MRINIQLKDSRLCVFIISAASAFALTLVICSSLLYGSRNYQSKVVKHWEDEVQAAENKALDDHGGVPELLIYGVKVWRLSDAKNAYGTLNYLFWTVSAFAIVACIGAFALLKSSLPKETREVTA